MVIGKFLLVALVFCVGALSQRPSSAEFNLFCRILDEANDMLLEPDYIYDEDKDKEIVREMEVLYNATTDDMDSFRRMLWDTKDFFEAHPPPTDAKNRLEAHREIGQLIAKGEKEIEENKKITAKVNEKIEEARLSVLRGLYGDGVKEVPKDEENLTKIQNDTESVFVDKESAAKSCGDGNETGKTLFNDLFCLCAGEGDYMPPCHSTIWPPKSWETDTGAGKWTQLKYGSTKPPLIHSFVESIEKIMGECSKSKEENSMKKGMSELLKDFEEMIGKGTKETNKKIFGHSGRGDKSEVTKCDGSRGKHGSGNDDHNEQICVDYTKHFKDNKYDIPWHEKFKNYNDLIKEAKNLEDQILKNRAALLLLKSEAWIAYSREKEDETSNLDDMNEGIKREAKP